MPWRLLHEYKNLVLAGLIVVFLGLSSGYFLGVQEQSHYNRLPAGTKIGGMDVGNLTKTEAADKLTVVSQEFLTQPLVFSSGHKRWVLTPQAIGFSSNVNQALGEAMKSKDRSFFRVLWRHFLPQSKQGQEFPLVQLDKDKALNTLTPILLELNQPPENATLEIKNDKVMIKPEKPGRQVDLTKMGSILEQVCYSKTIKEIDIPYTEIKPEITRASIAQKQIKGLVASFTTRFNPANKERTENIRVAAKALDRLEISPGATFSFNEIVGPRSKEAGYKEATVIQNNEFVQGVGGGVCQVSTTLYNSVLRANLPIVERSNHSLIIPYVPPGGDATVVYKVKDLKFRNPYPGNLMLVTEVVQDRLTVKIFGDPAVVPQVEIKYDIEEKIPAKEITVEDGSLSRGERVVKQRGSPGMKVKVTRIVKQDGKIVKTEVISRDYYAPVNRVIAIGVRNTGAPEPPAQPVQEINPEQQPQPEQSPETGKQQHEGGSQPLPEQQQPQPEQQPPTGQQPVQPGPGVTAHSG